MGKAIATTSMPGAGGSNTTPPGSVTAISVSGFIDPISAAITLTVSVTPPTGTTFSGCHLYLEIPDQSSNPAMVVGSSPVGGTAAITGPWSTIDLGIQPYVASQQPWTITTPAPPSIDPTVNTPCRLYAASFSPAVDNKLVQAGQTGATPNQTFTLVSLASGTPTSGTNVTGLIGGSGALIGITATVLSSVNVTGKLETPVLVMVTDTPANPPGWVAQLVLTLAGCDPTQAANQQVIPGYITQAGLVYAPSVDGISVPHSFALDTPTAFTTATLWLQAGLVDANGNYQWNNIVPGITPSYSITYGSTVGTTDAASVMAASIAASMAVVNGLFGVAALGVTNPLLGTSAVATINVQALAVTNPLLASLAVQAANMATGSVTAGNGALASLAVGTAALQLACVTNAIIGNLAVGSAQVQNAAITGALIANATIANANLGSLCVAQANIANLAVGTAQLQDLACTDAKIGSLSVTKLTAGTISVAVSLTAPTITVSGTAFTINLDATNGFKCAGNGTTVTIDNSWDTQTAGYPGIKVKNTTTNPNIRVVVLPTGIWGMDNLNQVRFQLFVDGTLHLFDSTGTEKILLDAVNARILVNGTAVTVP